MKKTQASLRLDPWILGTTLALVSWGVMMVYSASSVLAMERYGDPAFHLKRQILYVVLGLGLLLLLARVNYGIWKKAAYPLLILSLLALAGVLLPGIGTQVGGARRWFRLGPISLQPVEGVKFALVILLAHYLSVKGDRVRDFRFGFLPAVGMAGALAALVMLQPDAGSALLLLGVAFALLYLAGANLLHMGGLCVLIMPLLSAFVVSAGYRRRRLLAFLNPWGDPEGSGFQMVQSYLSFSQGGWTGEGLMQGKAKLHFLPAPHTDFIYAVLGEEFGLLGACAVLVLYGILLWKASEVAANCADPFGAYLAGGFTTLIGLQVLGNLGVVSGLLPTKGLPLPFFSAGGSALVISMAAIGMVLSVSARSRARRPNA